MQVVYERYRMEKYTLLSVLKKERPREGEVEGRRNNVCKQTRNVCRILYACKADTVLFIVKSLKTKKNHNRVHVCTCNQTVQLISIHCVSTNMELISSDLCRCHLPNIIN